jgi:hypothetical protein
VYVVQPDQFRDVVQQLTGATPTNNTAPSEAAPSTADANEALARHRRDGGGGDDHGSDGTLAGTTLRQMMDECIAWATDDGFGCDENYGESSAPGINTTASKPF